MNIDEWLMHASEFTFVVRHDDYRSNDSRFTIERRGPFAWAVGKDGFVLSKEAGEFIYEPLPSNRDEAHLGDTRFNGREQAYDALMRYLGTHRRTGMGWVTNERATEIETARRQANLCPKCGALRDAEGYCTVDYQH